MRVAVLTALTANYDQLREFPTQDVECDTICITDDPELSGPGWQSIIVESRPGVHPNLAAKPPKCNPWRYTDADLTVWLDASMMVQSREFVRAMCEYDFAQFEHPWRNCIYEELEASRYSKYARLPLDEQVDSYRQAGHPPNWGLWANGVIVRRRSQEMEKFGEAWLAECERWSFQDQLSEAPMLREHGLRPASIPGRYHAGGNPWLGYAGSVNH